MFRQILLVFRYHRDSEGRDGDFTVEIHLLRSFRCQMMVVNGNCDLCSGFIEVSDSGEI